MQKISPIITKITTVTLIFIGAFSVSAFATGVYTENPCPPPQCNIAAPLNTAAYSQYKQGYFGIMTSAVPSVEPIHFEVNGSGLLTGLNVITTLITNGLSVTGGANVTNNKAVLVNKDLGGGVGNGTVEWKNAASLGLGDGSEYHYVTPVKVYGINSGAVTRATPVHPVRVYNGESRTYKTSTDWTWSTVPYPSTSIIPANAKSVILRAYAQVNYWENRIYIQKTPAVPKQEIAHGYAPNNRDDAASDSSIVQIPYSTDRNFEATWYVPDFAGKSPRGNTETDGQHADIFVIGYTI